jgi:uncharacterized protein (UPF0147 family)
MQPEENQGERFSKSLLHWLTVVGAIATALTTIVAILFPNLGDNAQRFAYALAILLLAGSAGIFAYQRWRQARLAITEPARQLAPTAALRGLLPFEDGDQLRGRAHDVQQLYTLVTSSTFRFGVLWGESGCGKTSLLRAGLVPALRQNGFVPLYIPKPTKEPRLAIRGALEAIIDDAEDDPFTDIKRRFAHVLPKGKKIVVMFDQFEEFFLINRTSRSRTNFIKWLSRCIDDSDLPVVFLFGIRADFFAQLQNFAPHIDEPTSARTTYQLHNFDVEQAKQILSAAAKADGIQFEHSLIEAVVNDLEAEEQIRPAELQIVATRLKHKNILNLNKYEVLGRARGILSSYIGEEIKRSPNEEAARLILRLMCSETGETKSPTDLSLDDVVRGVSGGPVIDTGTSMTIQPEQVKQILEQFVSARILIRTDDDTYNLIHDYLALHVHTATAGTETNVERANRLLKRYVAESKEDPKTRIPFGRVREIQQYASPDVRSGEQAQRLLRRSKRAFYTRVSSILAIPLIPTLALYTFLANSYYLSVASQADGPHVAGRIVVMSGHPEWKFVPGFDHLIVSTDFTRADLAVDTSTSEMTKEAEDIPTEQVKGFWFKNQYGYRNWVEALLTRLSHAQRSQALRWLAQPDRVIEALFAAINDEQSSDVQSLVAEFVLLSEVQPELMTDEVVQRLQAIILDPKGDVDKQILVTLILARLAEAKPDVVTDQVLQRLRTIILDTQTDWSVRDNVISASVRLAQVKPDVVTDELFHILQSIMLDPQTDWSVRHSTTSALVQLAQVKPEVVTEPVLQRLGTTILDPQTDEALRSNTASALVQLTDVQPDVVTEGLHHTLQTIILDPETDSLVRDSAIPVLARLAEVKPDVVTERVLQRLRTIMVDPQIDSPVRDSTASAFIQLAEAKPALVTDEVLRILQTIMLDVGIESGVRDSAIMALPQLAEAKPALVTDGVLHTLQSCILDPRTEDSLQASATSVLVQLTVAKPHVMKDFIQRVETIILERETDSSMLTSANSAFVQLAQVKPDLLDAVLQRLRMTILDPQTDSLMRDRATATLVKVTHAQPDLVTDELLQTLQSIILNPQTSPPVLDNAVSALAQLADAKPEVVTDQVRQRLQSIILNPQTDEDVLGTAISVLRQLADVQPEVVTDQVRQRLQSIILNPQMGWWVHTSATSAFVQLAEAKPDLVTDEVLHTLQTVILDPQTTLTVRNSAIATLLQLAEAKPDLVTDGVLHTLQRILVNSQIESSVRHQTLEALAQAAEARPEVVTDAVLQTLQNVILDPETESDLLDAIVLVLVRLAQVKPEQMKSHLLHSISPILTNPEGHTPRRMDTARAVYELTRVNPHALPLEMTQMFTEFLTKDADSTARTIGAYGLYTLALADPHQSHAIRMQGEKLRNAPEPHVRMSGARLVEMLSLADWVQHARVDPEQVPQIQSRIDRLLYNDDTSVVGSDPGAIEEHIKFAGEIALEEIKKIEASARRDLQLSQDF